jgi:hypothetical protein
MISSAERDGKLDGDRLPLQLEQAQVRNSTLEEQPDQAKAGCGEAIDLGPSRRTGSCTCAFGVEIKLSGAGRWALHVC